LLIKDATIEYPYLDFSQLLCQRDDDPIHIHNRTSELKDTITKYVTKYRRRKRDQILEMEKDFRADIRKRQETSDQFGDGYRSKRTKFKNVD